MTSTTRQSTQVGSLAISSVHAPGTGAPILFLHGWGGSAMSWESLWNALRAAGVQRPFIALDFPGFGETLPPPQPWTVSDYAQMVIDWLNVHHVPQVDLVSHSFGGRVSFYLLADHPTHIASAALIAPAGIKHAGSTNLVAMVSKYLKQVLLLPGVRKLFPIARSIGYRFIGGQDYLQVNGVMKATFQAVVAEDLRSLCDRVQQPVQVFFGQHDSYVPWRDGEYMEQRMRQAHLTLFPDGRHGIHTTHAQQIAHILAPWWTHLALYS